MDICLNIDTLKGLGMNIVVVVLDLSEAYVFRYCSRAV